MWVEGWKSGSRFSRRREGGWWLWDEGGREGLGNEAPLVYDRGQERELVFERKLKGA